MALHLMYKQLVRGGLLVITLAKISAHYDLGMQAQLDVTNAQLFSETQGRYIVVVKEGANFGYRSSSRNWAFNSSAVI